MVLKAELHCHIEGAAHPELVQRLARKHGLDVSSVIDRHHRYIWHDFTSFVHAYDTASTVFRTPEDYRLLAYDHFSRLAAQDCIYGEVFASPNHGANLGLSYNEMIGAIAAGLGDARRETGVEGRIIVVGIRHYGPQAVEAVAQQVAANPHEMVTGFGLAGDERNFEVEDFANAFAMAADAGMSLTAHAGELAGAESVRDAIDHLGVTRIGHGVRAIEDPILVSRLVEEAIVLEVCPSSNVCMGVCADFKEHPFTSLLEQGVALTLASDDPPYFHTSIGEEYQVAADHFHLNVVQLKDITRTALEAAFVDEQTRRNLLTRLDNQV